MKTEIDLVDFGGGNVASVRRALDRLGVAYRNADAQNPPDGSRPLIVPGVGSFGEVMRSLRSQKLDAALKKVIAGGAPYLGICVGMQILFDTSEESGETKGLGVIPGEVVRFVAEKVPQIGWNRIEPPDERYANWDSGFAYFVNSFYAQPATRDIVLYESDYAGKFCAAVKTGNVTGFQFHPEKSGAFGAKLLERWVQDACCN